MTADNTHHNIFIRATCLDDAPGFHAALDSVAREGTWLARAAAPPLEKTRAFMQDLLATGGVQLVAVHQDHGRDQIIGWCDVMARDTNPDVGIVGMGIIAPFRGQGLGRQLLSRALDLALPRFSRITLSVRQNNTRARALYTQMGFVVDGCETRTVADEHITCDTMVLTR